MKTRRRRKRGSPLPPATSAAAPLSYWEAKVWETYKVARDSAEAGRVHPRTLKRHRGTARGYADYHARRYVERILGKTYADGDADRFDRLWRSEGSA